MNVLKITSTPIKLSMTSQRARLEAQLPTPHVNMEQTPGSIQMHSQNIKVNIDTYEQRQSLGRRTSQDFLAYQADKGKAAAQEATARYVQGGESDGPDTERGQYPGYYLYADDVPDAVPHQSGGCAAPTAGYKLEAGETGYGLYPFQYRV